MAQQVPCVEVAEFERLLGRRAADPAGLAGFFDAKTFWVARVPARLDVMGGIADYSGANVCEATLGQGILVAVQPRKDRLLRIRTHPIGPRSLPVETSLPLGRLESSGESVSYDEVRALYRDNPLASWAAYAGGSLFALLKEESIRIRSGFNLLLLSAVPMNAGIASSAAVEIGTLCALDACLGLGLDASRIAQLGQIAENRVVGAPCGIIDQIAIASGRRGQLVHILCRPGSVVGSVDIPAGTGFIGINSMVRHSVAARLATGTCASARSWASGSSTASGRRKGFRRWRISRKFPARNWSFTAAASARGDHGRGIPGRHQTHGDPATTVRAEVPYRIRGPVRHAVLENERVLRFIDALRAASGATNPDASRRGKEMYGCMAKRSRDAVSPCPRWMPSSRRSDGAG